ncbi:LPD7 domain-containing protein, partial [Caballeronia sp.]|uniref:LPD7 domain-containing protein n=1 Tax=Caballeronia sp. TaxID=1931223 RepID=UPI003C3FE4AD
PKVNLLTGQRLDPFGLVDRQVRFLEAFQEHTNNRFGLASPKDNRRAEFNDASEMISRYKGDVFAGANRELKASILDAMLSRGITRYEDFQALLAEFGETRTRNAGRSREYENVKRAGDAKGVNLKEYVFTREFVELDADAKREALVASLNAKYEIPGVPRETPTAMLDALREWHEVRALEAKYLNSGSPFYKVYQKASPEEQRHILIEREARFYYPFGGHDGREERTSSRRADRFGQWQPWRGIEYPGPGDRRGWGDPRGQREAAQERGQAEWGREWSALEREHETLIEQGFVGRWRAGADRDDDVEFDRPGPSAESVDSMRGVPGRRVDGGAARSEMLLSDSAHVHVEDDGADGVNTLRWTSDRDGEGGVADASSDGSSDGSDDDSIGHGKEQLAERGEGWRSVAERMYAAYEQADSEERARLIATSAEKFAREKFGLKGGGKLPRDFDPDTEPRSLAQVKSLGGVASVSFDGPAAGAQGGVAGATDGSSDGRSSMASPNSPGVADHPYHFDGAEGAYEPSGGPSSTTEASSSMPAVATSRDVDVLQPDGNTSQLTIFSQPATGRQADSVRDQLARDLAEALAARNDGARSEFQEIKATLDAYRLLAALSHSHGLVVGKYQITKGRDGADRIQAGSRNLNVSDFLTKEMNLSWSEAAQLMREQYRAQTGRDPAQAPRRTPEQELWSEFQRFRRQYSDALRAEWLEQGTREQARRSAIKSTFYVKRSAVVDNASMSTAERRAAVSVARVERVEAETVLRKRIVRERDALKAAMRRPLTDQYRDFLQEQAQLGNLRALRELRRMQPTRRANDERESPGIAFGTAHRVSASEPNEIIYSGPVITHHVQENGNVDYKRDGAALMVDEGRTVRMWVHDRDAIEIGLRLAQQKFGPTLTLTGPEEFKMATARVAAEARINVDFDDEVLSGILHARRTELDAEADDRRALERERDDPRRQDRDELPARTSNRDAPGASEQQRENDDPEPDSDEPEHPEIDR